VIPAPGRSSVVKPLVGNYSGVQSSFLLTSWRLKKLEALGNDVLEALIAVKICLARLCLLDHLPSLAFFSGGSPMFFDMISDVDSGYLYVERVAVSSFDIHCMTFCRCHRLLDHLPSLAFFGWFSDVL